MNYKVKLFNFLKNSVNREYCLPIMNKMLRANFMRGKFIITIDKTREKLSLSREEIIKNIENIIEFIVKKALIEGYNALAIPFIISKEKAPNFYIIEEKPKEDELWRFLYLILTGIHYGDFVLNLENVPEEIVKDFREWLINKNFVILEKERSGLNINELLLGLELPKGIPLMECEFILGFIFVSYFVKFWKEKLEEKVIAETFKKKIIEITDESSLVIFILSKQKKKMYIFPRLREIIKKYYEDFFKSDDLVPSISKFIFSLYITKKDYKEESANLLNKLLYYLLQGYVNGELLSKAIDLKISYELKENKIYGVSRASQFFSRI